LNLQSVPAGRMAAGMELAPGIALAVIFAIAATHLEGLGLGPALAIALVLGIAASHWTNTAVLKPGLQFAAKHLLALGVALLGIRLSFQDIMALGWAPAIVMVAAMAVTIGVSLVLARAMGLGTRIGILGGVGTAVCGASAAIATASVFPKDANQERDTSLVVVTVVALSALAMIVYPMIVVALGLSNTQAGIVLGGSIHNVPQAVAAGFTVSDTSGDVATLTKLFRVSLLAPIVIAVSIAIGNRGDTARKRVGIPWFILVFALLMVVGSVIAVPPVVRDTTLDVSNWLLLIAIAAIGMSTSLGSLRAAGPKVVVLITVNSLVLVGLLLGAALTGLV